MYKLNAILKSAGQTVNISEKFSKREFTLHIPDDKYPQTILMQLVNDKCSLLDSIADGQAVEVSFSLRGREWTKPETGEVKVFNTLEAFNVVAEGQSAPKLAPQAVIAVDEEEPPF
jgi:hypothetical protein